MYFRPATYAMLAILLIVSGGGCQKSASFTTTAPPTVLSTETVAHVHWLGKKQLGIMAGAYYFSRMWQLPASAQLERQTLYRLTTTPGQWLPGGTNLPAEAVPKLWLLLNDLVQEESYMEIRQPTNQAGQTVVAIRLNPAQTAAWRTNLVAILEPLTGFRAVTEQNGLWSLKTAQRFIQLNQVGDWTLVGVGSQANPLLAEVAARIQRDGVPFVSAGTNLWLEAGFDLSRLEGLFDLPALSNLNFAISGDGANVITQAKLAFAKPLPAISEPWHLPLPFVHEPLSSFTAMRGLQSWLAASAWWHNLPLTVPPDQLYCWSVTGNPYQFYVAAPMETAQVSAFTDWLLQKGNPWLAARGYINFIAAPEGNGVTWGDLPTVKPFIKSSVSGSESWLFAGMLADTNTVAVSPTSGLFQYILQRTNLVYYDWEVTGPRLQPAMEVAQTLRQIGRQPEVPANSASLACIGSLIPRLGVSATIIKRTDSAELTFYRRSTLGFTATELQLLATWLESPQFPSTPHSWAW